MRIFAAIILSFFLFTTYVRAASDFRFSPRPNKAALIHWQQWDIDLFSESKRLHKPILLALSAVWCHWCHVMDETTYSDADVIAYINENFIPVRVDVDMRPDLDSLYNQGGWPGTIVLDHKGDIVMGNTYVPQEDMLEWLKRGKTAYSKERKGIRKNRVKTPVTEGTEAIEREALKKTVDTLKSAFDSRYGGFGTQQKFPNPGAIDFLVSEFMMSNDSEIKNMITLTLDRMETGGIHDDISGGFFRYSTRPDWSAPHFEKMLDLNAGIAMNYAAAYLVLGKESYKKTLLRTIGYIMNNLFDKTEGVFYGSQDADETYYISKTRSGPAPQVDTTIYAGANAQMISALVAASGVTGSTEYLEQAKKAAEFILLKLYSKEKGTYHYYSKGHKHAAGLLADNVLFGSALVDLYNATGERKYIDTACDVAGLVAGKFFDTEHGLFRPTVEKNPIGPSDTGGLMEYNNAVLNLRAAVFLFRISWYREDIKLKELAGRVISGTKDDCARIGPVAGFCGNAFEWELSGPLEIVIITAKGPEAFLSAVNNIHIPRKVIKELSLNKDKNEIERLGYPLKESLYLCEAKRCFAAVTEPAKVAAEVKNYFRGLKEEK